METPAQIASLFSSLAPNSIVRFWAFQGDLATDPSTHEIDWAALDQVFYLAAQYHVYLIPTITDQGGTCDGSHWQDPSWYTGGYKEVFNSAANSDGTGDTPLSYWTYLQQLVNRYKDSPALGMWEPISEAEASTCAAAYQPLNCSGHQTCPNESVAAADLISFFKPWEAKSTLSIRPTWSRRGCSVEASAAWWEPTIRRWVPARVSMC